MGIKFPTPWKTLIIKFPPPQDGKGVKCPGYARGGGMLKLRFDRYISLEQSEMICLFCSLHEDYFCLQTFNFWYSNMPTCIVLKIIWAALYSIYFLYAWGLKNYIGSVTWKGKKEWRLFGLQSNMYLHAQIVGSVTSMKAIKMHLFYCHEVMQPYKMYVTTDS